MERVPHVDRGTTGAAPEAPAALPAAAPPRAVPGRKLAVAVSARPSGRKAAEQRDRRHREAAITAWLRSLAR